MKHTKSLFLSLLMTLISVGAYAQTNRLYIPDLKMSRGSEATLSVFMDNAEEITAVEFTLEVPTGFTVNPVSAVLTERAKNHQMTARKLKNGNYKFVVMSQSNAAIDGIAGRLFSVRVKSPDDVTDEGDYPLTISSAVMSVKSGQNVLQEADGGKITIKSMPNLHVVSLDCSEPIAGQPLTVKWIIRNDGRGSTGDASWKDYIWLVPNISAGTSMTGSKLLKSVDNVTALASGESYENTVNITLEERIYGNYDLVVTSNMYGATNIDFTKAGGSAPVPYDPENADYGFLTAKGNASYVTVEEENEYDGVSDNFFYKRINIQVPPLADIQVPRVVAVVDNSDPDLNPSPINSAGLASSSAFYSGKKVKVTATIANNGGADVNGTSINNVLYISSTPELGSGKSLRLSSHSMNLIVKAGESVTDEFTATIPYDWYGDTYFIVDADVNDAVYELANTANNSGVSDLINTLLTPGADFEPYDINTPYRISSGMKFDVSYAVRNIGPGVPFANTWKDKVYISSKNTGLDNSAKLIGTYSQNGAYSLAGEGYEYKGDDYKANRSVSVSGLQPGTYYIYIKVDAENAVLEYDGENNNVIMSKAITLADPDLTAEIISISEETLSTDSKVAVAWKLKNIGTADIQNATVKDGFYASSSANGGNAVSLGTASNTVSIVAGGEKTFRANITIPKNSSLNGTRYVYVKTNIDNTFTESSTANNSSALVAKQFVYAEDPTTVQVNGTNLTVSGLSVASTTTPGASLTLSYNVKNTGSLAIDKDVKQEILISKSKYFDSFAKALSAAGTLPTTTGLQPGTSVTANVNITIPSDIQGGQCYLFVIVNNDRSLAEKKYDDNQVKSPVYINGNLPNFTASNLVVPATVMTSEKTEVAWTLSNIGTWDAEDAVCTVFLSTDATLSSDDKQLASVRSGKLAKNGTVNMRANIELADNVVGTRYIIVKANASDAEESTTDDNIVSQQFTAKQSPLPDLTISELSTEGTLRGGQPVTIKAKVTNNGDSETHADKWTEVFYLSEGYTLDVSKAIKLGSKTHVGTLAKDGSYDIKADFTVPMSAKGYYVLFAVADGTNTLTEKSKDNNQTKVTVYVEDPSDTPADLAVTKMAIPSRIMAGEAITLSYNIANQGEYAAKGKLRDVLYMSKDNKWDENDDMIGVVNGDVNIDPATEITRTVTGRITNMPEGDYYLIVRTNSTHAIAESDYDNNQTVAHSASTVAFQTLSLGGSTTVNTSGLFKLPLHGGLSGKTVGLYLSTPEGASAGLYAAYNRVPSTARYDRSASDIETTQQEVLIPDVKEGNYYILAQDNAAVSRSLNEFVIDGAQELAEKSMTLSAREVQFGATTLSNTEGGTNGWISTEIHGALLDSIMDFRLAREGEMIPAESITFYDQTSSKATFNLNDAATGSYNVVSELPDGTQATLPDGFKVVPGTNVTLGVKLDAPKQTRISGYGPVSVTYVNGGNTDIVIRELLLTIRGGQLSTTIEGFKTNPQTALHIRPDVKQDNRGFVVIPPGKQETVNYYFLQTAGYTYLNLYIVK
ncbi:MAG: CARDB domain-containing protein [Bacteroidaceae bacterium]|nr:CARDB domain-containing protein [Bacteroidaceae bacterium]